jgi:hypothetical protein
MNTKQIIRNILYWVKRLVFDSLMRRYRTVDISIDDKSLLFLYESARHEQMDFNQFVEHTLRQYLKK